MRTVHCSGALVGALASGLVLATTTSVGAASSASAPASATAAATAAATQALPEARQRSRTLHLRGTAQAYGSSLSGNALASSGHTALDRMCTRQYPRTSTNHVAASQAALAAIAALQGVRSTNRTHRVQGRPAVTSTTSIADGELLEGLVTFDTLRSFSRVVKTRRGFRRTSWTSVSELRIGGGPVRVPQRGSRRYALPGVGELVYDLRGGLARRGVGVSRNLGLRLTLLDGTTLRLARSRATMESGRTGIFRGGAWGTEVPTVAGLLQAGRTTNKALPCKGTSGRLTSNDALDVTVPGVLHVDVSKTQARSRYLKRRRADALTRSTLKHVSLADGLVEVDVVRGEARALRRTNGSVRARRAARVVGLRVAGEEVAVPNPGRPLEIEGVARIERGVTKRGRRGISVVALRVTLLDALPAPVVVDLGAASAAVIH